MHRNDPVVRRLSDYTVSDYLVKHTDLEIDLTQKPVRVKAKLSLQPNPEHKSTATALALDGKNMTLKSVSLNGKPLAATEYELTDRALTIKSVPLDTDFTVETEADLGDNPDLFGLYKTEGTYLVKAETEGMRRVIYCKDRPDVLSTYRTRIIADSKECPTLLANGKLIDSTPADVNGVHSATWEDTLPKPTYLFAMVASHATKLTADFVTRSGRILPIEFYVRADAVDQCDFAIDILKRAMAWDEKTYGLECNLDSHKVAGVDKYASGASEPTGLNLFNTQYLFATPAIKTDTGFLRIAEVVSHEFFHYWTGDRVTIRDWHNLTVKEGLTSFRAADFCEDLFGAGLMRVLNGKTLEEGAPRLDSYTQVRSLYTAAAYDKSAEIFRMLRRVLGRERFYSGMNQFLTAQDGKAVTLEDMLQSLTKTSGMDVMPFMTWFTQAGVPVVEVVDHYDPGTQVYTLTLKQDSLKQGKKPFPIPVVISLYDNKGKEIYADVTLMLDKEEQSFEFDGISSRPVPSLLRDFSAPVHLRYDYSQDNLSFLMQHDSDLFNRTEAAKALWQGVVLEGLVKGEFSIDAETVAVLRGLLQDKILNPWIIATMLTVPSETALAAGIKGYDLDTLLAAREAVVRNIALQLAPFFSERLVAMLELNPDSPIDLPNFNLAAACDRQLRNRCLTYLSKVLPDKIEDACLQLFMASLESDMTSTIGALEILMSMDAISRFQARDAFYACWQHEPSAMNLWFRVQASVNSNTTVVTVASLLKHPGFDISNPNNVTAVMMPFLDNTTGFHAKSGEGYQLLADFTLQLEVVNPTLAASLVSRLSEWEPVDDDRKRMMHDQIMALSTKVKSESVIQAIKQALEKPFNLPNKAALCSATLAFDWMRPASAQQPSGAVEQKSALSLSQK